MKSILLSELGELLGGEVVSPHDYEVFGARGLNVAGAQDLSFAVGAYLNEALNSSACAVIVSRDVKEFSKPHIKVDNPKLAFAKVMEHFYGYRKPIASIHPSALVGESAIVGEGVALKANVVIEDGAIIGAGCVLFPGVYIGSNCKIGRDTVVFSNATIYHECVIGERCILHAGCVIGADGFGFVTDARGVHTKMTHAGNVIVGDDVEIGANTTIDRAVSDSTVIGSGTKIDNLVQIAHNVRIGRGCLIAACTGISGSVQVGDYSVFAGNVGVGDHINIGSKCLFLAKAGVTKDVPENSTMAGFPAVPVTQWRREVVWKRKIGDILNRLRAVESK